MGTSALAIADMTGRTLRLTKVSLKTPGNGSLNDGTSAAIILSAPLAPTAELFALTGGNWGANSAIYGLLDTVNNEFDVGADPINPGVSAFSLPLAALAAAPANVRAVMAQRTFDLSVRSGGPNGPVVYRNNFV